MRVALRPRMNTKEGETCKKPYDKKVDSGRRNFLTLAGAGAVVGGAAIASGGTPAEATPVAEEGEKLYRETDHVRRVYELSRF